MDRVADFLVRFPELTLFLAIGLGNVFGRLKLGSFALGPVTGSLFAGLLIGQFAVVPVSAMTKSFLFLLFLFGIGYSVGPQFLASLKRDGLNAIVLAVVSTVTGLGTAYVVARILGVDAGFAAGLLSGALTQSAAMGTATEAINALPLPEAERALLVSHVGVADALTYVFGAVGAIWFCSVLAPTLLRVDLEKEARELEARMGFTRETPNLASAYRQFEVRAFRVRPTDRVVGKTLGEIERGVESERLFVLGVRHCGELVPATPDTVVHSGDTLAVSGRRELLVERLEAAEEVEDRALLDVPLVVVDVLATKPGIVGATLEAVARQPWAHGVYLRSIRRGAVELPVRAGLVVERGDLLRLVGAEPAVKRAAGEVGPIVAPTTATDFIVLGLAIFLGGLLGTLIRIPLGDVVVSLGTSVGALLAGLAVGHMRTHYPLFGRIPDGAIALMTSLGLAAFVAMTGLHAGPVFIPALRDAGIGLLIGGVFVTLVPLCVGLFVGRFILKINPILLLGGLAGSLTMTAAMAAVQTRSGSPIAVLGYTPAYPIANILLTLWGTAIVLLIAN